MKSYRFLRAVIPERLNRESIDARQEHSGMTKKGKN